MSKVFLGHASVLGETSEHGKSKAVVKCVCGRQVECYIWSWAGHGYRVCPSCKGRISYLSLEVHEMKK